MSDYTTDLYLSWDDVQAMCRELAARIHAESPRRFTKILAVTRGGLFPAGILARELNIRAIETVSIASYDGMERREPVILKEPSPAFREDVLVVDDLADTGTTLRLLGESLKNAAFVTLFVKPQGADTVQWYARSTPQETWIRFPWDTVRQYASPVVKDKM